MSKHRWIRLTALCLVVAAVVVPGRVGPFEAQAKTPSIGAGILADLQAAANGGNAEAAAALAEFDRYAAARGLSSTAAANLGQQVREIAEARGLSVGAQGFAPFWVRLDGVRDFTSLGDIGDYRAARALALGDLAAAAPGRSIRVQVSFGSRPTPAEALMLVAQYRARIVEIHIDVVRDNARLMTYGSVGDAARAMTDTPVADVLREIRNNLVGAGLEACGADPATVELRVKFLRLDLAAADAQKLGTAPGVYAVDPMNDVIDQFTARAVHVDVAAWPNLTEPLEQFTGKALTEEPCEATK